MSSEIKRLSSAEQQVIGSHQEHFPVKLGPLAKDLGLKIVASTLPPGISGEIRPAFGGFVVSVNRHDSPRRQRFTVAHEIAHYLLHREQIGNGISDDALYRSGLSDSREAEANRLAADILMPRAALALAFARHRGTPDDELVSLLSDEFGVSDIAMKIRLGL